MCVLMSSDPVPVYVSGGLAGVFIGSVDGIESHMLRRAEGRVCSVQLQDWAELANALHDSTDFADGFDPNARGCYASCQAAEHGCAAACRATAGLLIGKHPKP